MSGTDVHGLALERLAWALEGASAELVLRSVLDELGLTGIYTPADLCAVGGVLRQRSDPDEAWVGALLVLHGIALAGTDARAA